MKYELRMPAIHGDVIPLIFVASEMARAASTAYGTTPPHKPMYKGQLPGYVKLLLNISRAGHLLVCNQFGDQRSAEELIAEAKRSGDISEVSRFLVEPDWEKLHQESEPILPGVGVLDFTGIDLGPTEIDWDRTNLGCLFTKLQHLNEWGKTKGDEFVISSDGVEWIDERGVQVSAQDAATPAPVVAEGASDASEKPVQRSAAQDAAILTAIREVGLNPLALPKNEPGKAGPKAAIRLAMEGNPLFVGKTVFNKAWERLSERRDIVTISGPTR